MVLTPAGLLSAALVFPRGERPEAPPRVDLQGAVPLVPLRMTPLVFAPQSRVYLRRSQRPRVLVGHGRDRSTLSSCSATISSKDCRAGNGAGDDAAQGAEVGAGEQAVHASPAGTTRHDGTSRKGTAKHASSASR